MVLEQLSGFQEKNIKLDPNHTTCQKNKLQIIQIFKHKKLNHDASI